jgi:ribosome-associated protein
MDDTFQADDRALALEVGKLIQEHRGIDVLVMDLRQSNTWTDFFVVATVTSNTHVQGLKRHIKEFVRERGLETLNPRRKTAPDDEWNLIDFGTVVIHLMTAKCRAFYELERLWNAVEIIKL